MPVPFASSHVEEIRAPLAIVRRMLAENSTAEAVPEHFKSALDGKWDQVPLLNDVKAVEQLKPGSLVRFRCMVQNMYNPELYLGEYDHVNSSTGERVRVHAQYCDAVDVPHGFTPDQDENVAKLMERLPLHCMSIPHESSWVSQSYSSEVRSMESAAAQRDKRTRCDDDMQEQASKKATEGPASPPATPPTGPGISGMECDGGSATQDAPVLHSAAANKSAGGRPVLVPGATNVKHAAIVKMYQDDVSIKVNEAYEFVGVLCCDPAADHAMNDCHMRSSLVQIPEAGAVDSDCCMEEVGPASSSVIPRIHVVAHRQLTTPASPTWNPALDTLVPAQQVSRRKEIESNLPALRARIVRSLSSVLLGDTLAAEYLLCHIISHISNWISDDHCVGNMSLTLNLPRAVTNAPNVVKHLTTVLEELLPSVAYVPIERKYLDSKRLFPKKNYETEVLESGDLQVMASTQVVLDETVLTSGQLKDNACRNMDAIQELISFQRMKFDFQFYVQPFKTDVPVLLVTQGKSLIKTSLVLNIQPDAQAAAAQAAAASSDADTEDMKELCRIYIGLARSTGVQFSDEMATVIQNTWIQARHKEGKNAGQEELHFWVTLVKWVAASHGASAVTQEHWDQTMAMEQQRLARVVA